MDKKEIITSELNNENTESMIYSIRGQKVMLDFELAKIYGYETRRFNEQVKNNIDKFDNSFRFQLTQKEVDEILWSKKSTANVTANSLSKRRHLPYAFTEQGIYMLITILKPKTEIHYRNIDFLNDYFRQPNNILNYEKTHKQATNYEIVRFENGNISLDVRVSPDEENIWLTQAEIAILYGTTIPNISMHIANIFDDKELIKNSVIKKFLNTASDGKTYNVTYYSLDVVLSVGYRVNTQKGIEFRRWCNNILKQYLIKGYSINEKRCLEHSDILLKLQNDINPLINRIDIHDKKLEDMEKKVKIVMENFIDPNTYKHYLILNGERIESDVAYQEIYKLAKSSIYIIDDYIDIKTLQLLKCCKYNIEIIIISDNKAQNKLNKSFINDFKKDTNINASIKKNNGVFHSRYIVLDFNTDNYRLYFCGGSSKDGGNKINTIQEITEKEIYVKLINKRVNNTN